MGVYTPTATGTYFMHMLGVDQLQSSSRGRATEAKLKMHWNQTDHPSNAQPKVARSSFWRAATAWAMMVKRGRRLLAIVPDAARSGFLPRRSYVAPSPQRRSPTKRPEVELNPRPI